MQGNYLKAETDSAPEEGWRTWFESTTGIHVKEKTLKPNVKVGDYGFESRSRHH